MDPGYLVGTFPENKVLMGVMTKRERKLFTREKIKFFQLVTPVIMEFLNETTD